MKRHIKLFSYLFKLKRPVKYFIMPLVLFILLFSLVGCQKEEPDGIKIQKSDNGVSISGKYGDKSVDIEKSNKSDKGISINGKSGDSSFSFNNSKNGLSEEQQKFIIIAVIIVIIIIVGLILCFIIGKIADRINKHFDEQKTKKDTEVYSKTLNQDKITCDYKEKSSELNKIYNLYKNKIYNDQEYKSKKSNWIKSLKTFNFDMVEIDFLNEMVSFVNDGVIEKRELETIKYIVSGEYKKDKYKKQKEKELMAEEEARKKREETINNIKTKTKEMASSTVNKINSVLQDNSKTIIVEDNKLVCECGMKFEEEDIFCANCGKKLK